MTKTRMSHPSKRFHPFGWGRTIKAIDRLSDRIHNGRFEDRLIITRDSPINGGVYIGAKEREAIVVDSLLYPGINRVFEKEVKLRIRYTHSILPSIYSSTLAVMRYDESAVNEMLNRLVTEPDVKVTLDRFIDNGIGVCRHMALLSGVLIELCCKEGRLTGRPSIDRNESNHSAHVWCRYTRKNGEVYIVDPAHKFFGTLKDSIKSNWNYLRPGEKV